jgi:hypothetical protein
MRLRTGAVFPEAILYTPDTDRGESEVQQLAPLLVVRTGASQTELASPVFAWQRSVTVASGTHVAIEYAWAMLTAPDGSAGRILERYRLSLLLADDGFPLVAAARRLSPPRDERPLIFAPASLDAAARARYGGPAPGRAFAVEATLDAAPDVIVAGILEDGPVPLGPYVYIEPAGRGVVTVLCRCSPAQFESSVAGRFYPLEETASDPVGDGGSSPENVRSREDPWTTLMRALRWPFGDDTTVAR